MAMNIVGKTRQTIDNWRHNGRISYIVDAGGHPLIVYSSLFLPQDKENVEDRDTLSPAKRPLNKHRKS